VSPEATTDFEQAVSHARERLEDLSSLMLVANSLDELAGDVILDNEDGQTS
jgi:hypothetical protein